MYSMYSTDYRIIGTTVSPETIQQKKFKKVLRLKSPVNVKIFFLNLTVLQRVQSIADPPPLQQNVFNTIVPESG